jgi:hypothetical protein
VEAREAEAWMLRAERHVDADSVNIVRVHCDHEKAATHTVPSSPERASSARLPSARGVGSAERGLYGGNSAAARTRSCRRIQTAGEERIHPIRIERERIASADPLGAPHETNGADALLDQEDGHGDVVRSASVARSARRRRVARGSSRSADRVSPAQENARRLRGGVRPKRERERVLDNGGGQGSRRLNDVSEITGPG